MNDRPALSHVCVLKADSLICGPFCALLVDKLGTVRGSRSGIHSAEAAADAAADMSRQYGVPVKVLA